MNYSRRDFGKLALGGIPLAAVCAVREKAVRGGQNQTQNSVACRLAPSPYSYRSMPDQSAEAILRYVVDSGHQCDRVDGRSC